MATARRLGLDAGVLERAESLMGEDALRMDALRARLEEESRAAALAREEGEAHRRRYERLETEYEGRMREGRKEQRRILEDARREGERFMGEARKEVGAAVRAIREREADRESIATARRSLEDLEARNLARYSRSEDFAELEHWRPGDRVRMRSTGRVVSILEAAGAGRLRVSLDGLSMVLPLDELTPLDPVEQRTTGIGQRATDPMVGLPSASLESFRLDLRGRTVEEALDELDAFLDAAVLGGYEFVEVLHGKGTGALRLAVREHLRRDPRVKGQRLADQNRGGSGVTRVDLAGDGGATILGDP